MIITKEKYKDFLNGNCPPAEHEAIADYLQAHPELLDELLQFEDWESFGSEPHVDVNIRPDPSITQRIWTKLSVPIRLNAGTTKTRMSALAIAAVCTSLLILSVAWMISEKDIKNITPIENNIEEVSLKTTTANANRWTEIDNKSGSTIEIRLNDGSIAHLHNAGKLRYNERPSTKSRDIYLSGAARFKVKKDNTAPFNVYSSGIVTTALGTAFTVSENFGYGKINVQLHEGKIVVRSADSTSNTKQVKVIMNPGETLIIHMNGKYNLVPAKNKTNKAKQQRSIMQASTDQLTFNQTPLPEVLARLMERFAAKIKFNAEALRSIHITASFTQKDDLRTIMQIICALNNLQLKQEFDVFIVNQGN